MTPGRRNALIVAGGMLAILLAFTVDQPIARFMADTSPQLLRVIRFVTWFGQGGVTLYPTGLIVIAGLAARSLLPGLRQTLDDIIRKAAAIFITVAVAGLADDLLKIVFGRARPYRWLAGDDSGFGFFRYGAKFASFPSGHTTTSVAAALAFGAIFPRGRPVFLLAALSIAISRIVLDAHYVSDVIGGGLIGWIRCHFRDPESATQRQGWLAAMKNRRIPVFLAFSKSGSKKNRRQTELNRGYNPLSMAWVETMFMSLDTNRRNAKRPSPFSDRSPHIVERTRPTTTKLVFCVAAGCWRFGPMLIRSDGAPLSAIDLCQRDQQCRPICPAMSRPTSIRAIVPASCVGAQCATAAVGQRPSQTCRIGTGSPRPI